MVSLRQDYLTNPGVLFCVIIFNFLDVCLLDGLGRFFFLLIFVLGFWAQVKISNTDFLGSIHLKNWCNLIFVKREPKLFSRSNYGKALHLKLESNAYIGQITIFAQAFSALRFWEHIRSQGLALNFFLSDFLYWCVPLGLKHIILHFNLRWGSGWVRCLSARPLKQNVAHGWV